MTRILVIILSVIALAACSRTLDDKLVRVNRLANENLADSAMQALDSIDRASLDEYNRHYYDLMTVKTRDKADFQFDSDSLVLSAMEYFKKNGTDTVRAEAFYYAGRVARMLGDSPQALDYMQNALNCLDDSHTRLKGKISSQMGQIFQELYMFEQAKPRFIEAIHFQNLCNDSLGLMFNYCSLASIYKRLEQPDSAFLYYEKSLLLSHEIEPNGIDEIETRAAIIDFYIRKKDIDKALSEYKYIEPYLNKSFITDFIIMTAVNINIITKDYEKAEVLSDRLSKSKNLRSKEFAYSLLADIAKQERNDKKLYKYTLAYKICLDSINSRASQDAIIHQNSFYNYSLKEKEKFKIEKRYLRNTIIMLFALSVISFITSIIIYVYRSMKKRNKVLFIQNTKLSEANENLVSDNLKMQISLAQQLDKIKDLENHITHIENSTQQQNLSEKIQEQITNRIKDINSDNYEVHYTVLESEVYAAFRSAIQNEKGVTNKNLWQQLDDVINTAYPKFRTKLYYLNNGLKNDDYQICLLIKCNFSIREIALLTFRSKNAIINRRTRLYFKLFGINGTPNDLDRYILSL